MQGDEIKCCIASLVDGNDKNITHLCEKVGSYRLWSLVGIVLFTRYVCTCALRNESDVQEGELSDKIRLSVGYPIPRARHIQKNQKWYLSGKSYLFEIQPVFRRPRLLKPIFDDHKINQENNQHFGASDQRSNPCPPTICIEETIH